MLTVASIEEMQAVADSTVGIFITDKDRGGFFRYSTTDKYNNGTEFNAAGIGAGVWQRIYPNQDGLNVKWFGAKGDGVTNDATALQAGIQAAATARVPLVFPAGIYYLTENTVISLPSSAHLKGAGKKATVIQTSRGFSHDFPALVNVTGDNVTIQDMGFNGGRPRGDKDMSMAVAGRYALMNITFDAKPAKDILIERCSFADAFGRGILYKASQVVIRDCDFKRIGRYNIDFAAVDGAITNFGRLECSDVLIERNHFEYVGTHCISSYKVEGLKIRDNYLDHISGIGMANQQCSDVDVSGNNLNHTGDNGMDFQRCERIVINNNSFNNAGDKNAGNAGSAAAIFVGDDYGLAASSSTIISNNFVTGTYTPRSKTTSGSFQNCGFYIIDANHVKVTNNIIRYIGALPADKDAPVVLEDGNGIMVVNTQKGAGTDIVIEGNTLSNMKCNGIYVNGQSRELKIKNNYIDKFGLHGLLMCAIGTNLFSQVEGNTIVDGTNFYNRAVAADIYVEAQNAWITNFNISRNQLRNDSRGSYSSRNDTVFTTHGIYFSAKGFGKFNNLLVTDNQVNGHLVDEIGFSDNISEYSVTNENYFPLVSFKNNFSGSTDDQPDIIIPGLNQRNKPKVITESYGQQPPVYGNYSAGSVIRNISPQNDVYGWVAANSGFAAGSRWKGGIGYAAGQTVYINEDVYRCTVAGVSGKDGPVKKEEGLIADGGIKWEYMGNRVYFKKVLLRDLR
ncbi:right-handed parallel beta-helix repeat-containing protein [Filimonas lacunae]|nr:right-handed parallel beta-helix repeat-containing protein [Filimonas lacunae]